MQKRQSSEVYTDNEVSVKKGRFENALVAVPTGDVSLVNSQKSELKRTSGLSAPTIQLTGHEGAVYALAFDPTGQYLASGSFDKQILLWDVYGENTNYNVLSGHKSAVLEVKWRKKNPSSIVSCSADKTIGIWDSNKGRCIRKLTEHKGIVNTCDVADNDSNLVVSGSDDNTARLWDDRSKWQVSAMQHTYQVTSVAMDSEGSTVYTGGIDNIIRRWDIRNVSEPVMDMELPQHTDTVTGLCLSPNNNFLLSNSMDCSLLKWDMKPFITPIDSAYHPRCLQKYDGARHGAEKVLLKCSWSPDMDMVACGSADRIVHIWDSETAKPLYYLPGHKGSVNDVVFHPAEPIIASCSTDKTIFIGELS